MNMKKRVIVLTLGVLFIGTNLFAANGDLIVNGNAGIGTTDPGGYKLRVKGGNTKNFEVDNDGSQYTSLDLANNGTYKTGWYWDNTNSAAVFNLVAGGRYSFLNGNIGIGTTNPLTFLDVAGAGAKVLTGRFHAAITDLTTMGTGVGGGLTFVGYKTAQSTPEIFAGIDGYKENSTAGNAAGAFRIFTQANGTGLIERLRITSTGNVGIGTTTPNAKLQVKGSLSLGSGSAQANKALCWTSTGTIGYCSSSINSQGGCTCNAIN